MQIIFLLLGYVLQTTWLAKLFPVVHPDLLLVLLIICISNKGFVKGLGWGLGVGLFLDIFSGFNYFYIFVYALLGGLIGLVPGDFFRDYRTLAVTNTLAATILLEIVYLLASGFIFQRIIAVSFFWFLFLLLANGLLAYFLADPLARLFGIDIRA